MSRPTFLSRAALRRLETLTREARRTVAPARRRSYAAAQFTRITDDWSATLLDPADETKANASKLRGRARDLRRNNPLVARYAQLAQENIVGPDGLTLQAKPQNTRGGVNDALRKECEAAWYQWGERAALDGATWDAVCRQLVESWRVDAGEAYLELVIDPALPLGIGVQIVDPDLLDHELNVPAGDGQREIVQGVEIDAFGAPVAYHLWTLHPAAVSSLGKRRSRRVVPAERLLVLAHQPRVGMVRGITPLAPAMLRLQMLNGTQEALVMLHRVAASKMGWIQSTGDADPLADPTSPTGALEFSAEPLSVEQLPINTTFVPWDPGQPTQQYDPFRKSLLQEIAAGLGVSYASLTGDLSEANYSSARVGLLAERDRWRVLQREFTDAICRPVYAAVLRMARVRGLVSRPDTVSEAALCAAEWHGRRWDWVDPTKDVAAVQQMLASGLTTLTRECNARGIDVADLLRERATELALAKSLGVPLQEAPPAAAPDEGDAVDEKKPTPIRAIR